MSNKTKLSRTVAASIQALMDARNESGSAFGSRIGLNPSIIYRLLKSESDPQISTLDVIADAAGVPAFYLLMTAEERAKWDEAQPKPAPPADPATDMLAELRALKSRVDGLEKGSLGGATAKGSGLPVSGVKEK